MTPVIVATVSAMIFLMAQCGPDGVVTGMIALKTMAAWLCSYVGGYIGWNLPASKTKREPNGG